MKNENVLCIRQWRMLGKLTENISQSKNTQFLGEVIAFYQENCSTKGSDLPKFLIELSKFFTSTADHLCLLESYSIDGFRILLVKGPFGAQNLPG